MRQGIHEDALRAMLEGGAVREVLENVIPFKEPKK